MSYLRERQRLRSSPARRADALLDQPHRELPVRHAVRRPARVLGLAVSGVRVHAQQDVFEALGGVGHAAQAEAPLAAEGRGQGATHLIWWQSALPGELQLGEELLEQGNGFISC